MKSDFSKATKFTGDKAFMRSCEYAVKQLELLNSGKGKGNDFLGWINLPQSYDTEDITDMITIAESFRTLDAVVVIGIGGSYLGAKAVIEALKPHFNKTEPEIIFAGHNLSGNYHSELIEYLQDKEFGIIVISKSGTTTEPAVAFRLLYNEMKKRFDKET
ncbi:MAG: glucose-6-phosphate isomerase, partial [Bacteroidales bacterium]|nr:glucose-6-phosphate isomerase [Bacteroidales bacterium]